MDSSKSRKGSMLRREEAGGYKGDSKGSGASPTYPVGGIADEFGGMKERRYGKDIPDERIVEAYRSGGTLHESAEALKVSAGTLRLRLEEMGIMHKGYRSLYKVDKSMAYADADIVELISKKFLLPEDICDIKLESGPLKKMELKLMLDLASFDPNTRREAVESKYATGQNTISVMSKYNMTIRCRAVQNGNATEKVLELAMVDVSFIVRHNAVNSPKATRRILDMGVMDHDPYIKAAAMKRRG